MESYNEDQETAGGQADGTIEDEGDVGALRTEERLQLNGWNNWFHSSDADLYWVWSVNIYH